jgi:hypothetical protein
MKSEMKNNNVWDIGDEPENFESLEDFKNEIEKDSKMLETIVDGGKVKFSDEIKNGLIDELIVDINNKRLVESKKSTKIFKKISKFVKLFFK